MSFTLPPLPYAYDALAPYMSRETLEYHHDKHHQAYVDNGNKLLQGSPWEGQSLEQIVVGSFGKNAGLFNNAGQHYNHLHFWKWMKPGGGGGKLPGDIRARRVEIAGDLLDRLVEAEPGLGAEDEQIQRVRHALLEAHTPARRKAGQHDIGHAPAEENGTSQYHQPDCRRAGEEVEPLDQQPAGH